MSDIPISNDGRAEVPDASPASRGLTSTLVLGLGTFAVGTDAFVVAGFLPVMAQSLRVSPATAGQSVTAFAAAYAVLSPIVATLTARMPRRMLLAGALIVLGLANLASALSPNFPALVATRILAAAGAAAYTPGAGAVSTTLVRPEQRARALAVVVGGLTIATALGVPLGNVTGKLLGWRTALGLVAVLCLLVAGGVAAIMPSLPGTPRVPLRSRLMALRRPAVLVVLPLTVLGMAASYTAYAYSVPVLRAAHVPEYGIVWVLFLYGLGAVLGNLLAGAATDRFGSVRVLAIGYLCMAVSLGLLGWLAAGGASLLILVGLTAVGWGASTWCQTPPQQHRLIAAAQQQAPLVVALNSSGIYLGIGLGTLLGGVTLQAGAWAIGLLGAALATTALLYLLATARTVARSA
jgi:MFS transporter, DHA1 family, inner membrane transport protein